MKKTFCLFILIVSIIVVNGNFVYGHGPGSYLLSPQVSINDEMFSSENVQTNSDDLTITGRVINNQNNPQTLKLSILVTTDQFPEWSVQGIIHNLLYGMKKDYQDHASWYFKIKTDLIDDQINLKPYEEKQFHMKITPLKSGTYHMHTQLISEKTTILGPGQTIVVTGSSELTIGEIYGVYLKFVVIFSAFILIIIFLVKKQTKIISLIKRQKI